MVAHLRITDNAVHGYQLVEVDGIGATLDPTQAAPLATFISRAPPRLTTKRFAVFGFGVAEKHPPFSCWLDRRPVRPCTSPTVYRHLSLGHHTFRVKPSHYVVGVSRAPAVARFTVVPKSKDRI
jgi:hypothetical protein